MEIFFISSVFVFFLPVADLQTDPCKMLVRHCFDNVTTPGDRGSFLQPPPGVLKAVRQEEIFY